MIFFGWVCPVELKMWFARKAKQNWKYLQSYSLVLTRVDKAPGYLYWDHGGSSCTDIKIFQIFLKKKYMLFLLKSAFLKRFSDRPKHARKKF